MTIDKEKLISLLIKRTELDRGQVEGQLSELINRIQQAAKDGKTFEIEGFGVFSMEDGNLQFKPHDTLETEINNKYAGMKPIELIGAFKEPEGDEVPDMPEEASMPPNSDADAEKEERWAFDESAADEEVSAPQDSEQDRPKEGQAEPVEEGQATPEAEDDTLEDVFGTDEGKPSEPLEEKPALESSKDENDAFEEKPDTLGRVLVAAVVVIALGVGGWFIYDMGFSGNSTSQTFSEQTAEPTRVPAQQTKDTQQEASSETSEVDKTSEPEQQKQVVNQGDSQSKAEQQEPFGLQGTINKSAGGYTIVVHSLRSLQKAENRRQDLESSGYRSLISSADVNGTTYFRVGIGQFETVRDAQQAMTELPERYRENNFIRRIQ